MGLGFGHLEKRSNSYHFRTPKIPDTNRFVIREKKERVIKKMFRSTVENQFLEVQGGDPTDALTIEQ